jgi:L-asparaginase
MRKDFDTGALKAFNFSKLLQRIPELKQLDCEIETISFEEPIDSSNMNPSEWARIASIVESNYLDFDGFVVLHGSDTMSYSASALSFMLENLAKPVIFTGSQLPIGDLRTDAKENLITAIQIASLQENGCPLLLRCAFILNISCIEETERPRSMRNILRHSRHPIILLWSNLGFI